MQKLINTNQKMLEELDSYVNTDRIAERKDLEK